MTNITDESALRLVEIQFSVLPEAEWLMGITDLSYFPEIGFSLPIPFDVSDFESGEGEDALLHALADSSDSNNLFAFLPGLFYCSLQNTTVDGIIVEVTEKNLLGMKLGSFRPEGVRTFDIRSGLAVDEQGKIHSVEMSSETIGKFATGLSTKIAESLHPFLDTTGTLSLNKVAYAREIEIAGSLAKMLPLQGLKRAYISGAILTGQMMMLLSDIESNGFQPRNRIYVKNSKYPEGKVVDVRYRSTDEVHDSRFVSGVDCPNEIDLGLQLMRLSFARMVGDGKEVDIEEAILDIVNLFHAKLGVFPTKDQIMEIIFSEEFH